MLFSKILNITLIINNKILIQRQVVFAILQYLYFPYKLTGKIIASEQGGRKVILDGGSLFIGKIFENWFFLLF